jgi:hypothetical protein
VFDKLIQILVFGCGYRRRINAEAHLPGCLQGLELVGHGRAVHAQRGGDLLGADLLGGLVAVCPGEDLQDRQGGGVGDLASGPLQAAGDGEQGGHQLLHVLRGRAVLGCAHGSCVI